ncbi:hypothetical protein DIRU0_B14246 [Diutina rugosa]
MDPLNSEAANMANDPHTPKGMGSPRFGMVLEPPDISSFELGALSSANFSTESLDQFDSPTPTKPSQSPFRHARRSSVGSPLAGRQGRPMSAVLGENDLVNLPRSRNSMGPIPKSVSINSLYASKEFGPMLGPPRIVESSPGSHQRSPRSRPVSFIAPSDSPVVLEDEELMSTPPAPNNPFNFTSQNLSNTNLSVKPAHRRGHKYKHSSVSMNLFQEPPPATISVTDPLPETMPLPSKSEVLSSINTTQKLKLFWSAVHFTLALAVFLIGFRWKISVFSTLAHLIFYDALGSLLVVTVDIMSNFDMWNKSSLRYPFGLGRLEVLVAFALSASLLMVAFDLVSHFVEGVMIEMLGSDEPHEHSGHHIHDEGEVTNWLGYELVLLVTVAVTLFTTFTVRTNRINQMVSDEDDVLNPERDTLSKSLSQYLRSWTRNPTHILTLGYTAYLMVQPLVPSLADVHELVSLCVALMLLTIGWRLVKQLGSILLCAYPANDYDYDTLKSTITNEITALDFFRHEWRIEQMFITKFNYDRVVVGMKIEMRGATADDDSRVRFEVNRIVRRHLALRDDPKTVEITLDIHRV